MFSISTVTLLLAVTAPGSGEASASGSLSTDTGASGDADASADADGDSKDEKWIHRWPPENNMWELGVFGGIILPSKNHELFLEDTSLPDDGWQELKTVGPDFGLRAAYYPLRFLGVEAEGAFMPMRAANDARANLWGVRGHVVGQLGLWSITPFALAGAGALSVASGRNALGNDVDAAIHFGVGAKFFINRWIMLRLDLRDNLTAKRGVADGVTQTFEILLGVSVTLGRKKGGPAKDTDGDGIPDWRDRCDEVPGVKPHGCPPDTDKDGIIDVEDECPEEPESKNNWEDSDGCPDEVPTRVASLAGIIKGIQFDVNKATIKAESKPILDDVAEQLKKNDDVKVEIVGHTDSTGGRGHNIQLSKRRANSVKRYLVNKGVDESRITTRGAGPDEPIAPNDTPEGRAQNRRIEFLVESQTGKVVSSDPDAPEPAPEP